MFNGPFKNKGLYFEADTGFHGGDANPSPIAETQDPAAAGAPEGLQIDAPAPEATPEGQATPEAGTTPEPFSLEVGGKVYSEAEVLEAFNNHNNMGSIQTKLNEQIAVNKAITQAMEQQRTGVAPTDAPQHVGGMTAAALQEALLSENPENAMQALQSFVSEAVNSKADTIQEEDAIRNQFLDANPDYYKVVGDPNFQAYRGQNLHYDEPQAYAFYKLSQVGQQTQQVADTARREGEQTALNHQAAKQSIRILNGAGSAPIGTTEKNVSEMSEAEMLSAATAQLIKSRAG